MDNMSSMAEGEEALTLSEVLSSRSEIITELELWALCRECALTLEYVQNQRDMYEGLCITPETVAFDQTGSVCFLDLGAEPESFFVPPEYENGGCTDKAQLFSLGMTMLYAVEHNDSHKPELSQKFTDLLSQLTADDSNLRPELEAVITECEEVLHGQSSQDICLHLSTIIPSPTSQEANNSSILDLTSGLTAYLQSQSGIVVNQSPASDLLSPGSENTESDRNNMDHHYRNRPAAETCVMDSVSKNFQDNEIPYLDKNQNVKCVNSERSGNTDQCPNRTSVNHGHHDHRENPSSVHHGARSQGKYSSDSPSGVSRQSEYYSQRTSLSSNSNLLGSVRTPVEGSGGGSGGDCPGGPEDLANLGPFQTHQSVSNSPGQMRPVSSGDKEIDCVPNGRFSSLENHTSTPNSSGVEDNQLSPSPSKESRKKQGMTISDIIDWVNRYLREKELWALCREGILALQRKKKHLPAYISPDTVVVRGDGSVTFKAIPEDKPLEVIFMAPELQQKGVLSEKTCLYGLGITLRCAAGQKYSTSLSLQVSQKFEQLLLALLQPVPDKRPSLRDTLQMCDDHEADGHLPSKMTCLELYDSAACVSSNPQESIVPTHKTEQTQSKADRGHQIQERQSDHPGPARPPHVDDDDVVSEEELNLEYVVEEEQDLGYDHVEEGRSSTDEQGLDGYGEEESYVDESENEFQIPSPPTGFKPVTKTTSNPSKGSPGSAFKPVSVKPIQSGLSDGVRVPSAFSSPATHFKPIVLQGTNTHTASQGGEKSSDFNLKDKEKEVMKKLKELENELSRPRKGVGSGNSGQQGHRPHGKENTTQDSVPANPLESLLQQLQEEGQMPNTQSLASAIAHHLKTQTAQSGHLNQAAESPNSLPSTQMHQMIINGQSVPSGMSSNPQHQMLPPTQFPTLMNPGQTYPHPHHNVLDQSHSYPMQYGSSMYPGYPPMPMQLQQDPRTGMMTWVPILPYPVSQSPDFYRNTSSNPSQPLSGYSSDSHSNQNRSDLNESFHNEELSSSPYRSRGPSSASSTKSARDHASSQRKTVSQTPTDGYVSETNAVRGPKSEHFQNTSPISVRERHSVHNVPGHDQHGHLTNESRSSPHIRHFQSSMKQLSVPGNHGNQSDSPGATTPQRLANQITPSTPNDDSNASQTSSPSPSKDSGVSGVQLPAKPYPYHNSDASLMDRLLSPESIHRQKVQGRVLQLVREEQGFDMLFEQNAEDCAMAEYITSLANLKWETFVSAITEKYSELYWGEELMCRLYDTINCRPNGEPQTSSMSRTPPPPPARYSSYVVTENMNRDRSENREREWREPLHPRQNIANHQYHQQHDYSTNKMPQDLVAGFDRKEKERRFNDRSKRHPEYGSRKAEPLPNKPKIVTSSTYSPRGAKNSEFSNERSQSACPRFIGSSTISETSDSTDTEMRDKKRRYKKRYELDRAKSSSMHNLSSGAVFSAPENRRSDSYVVDIPIGNGFLSQGETTPVNRGTPHQPEDFCDDQPSHPVQFPQREYSTDRNKSSSSGHNETNFQIKPPDTHHRNSIQERYIDNSNRPPTRKAISLSPTPILDYSTRYSSGNFEDYKYNSLPRDVFKRQTSASTQRASYTFQQYDNSRQPVLDRKQEISQRVGRENDHLNTALSNISAGELVSKPINESDSETSFRDNVRRTSAKIMQQNTDRCVTEENRNSYRGNGSVKEKVSQAKQQKVTQLGQRTSSSSSLPVGQQYRSTESDKTPGGQEVQVYTKTGQVVYHWSGIQLNMASEVEAFIQEIEQEEDNKSLLEQRLSAINQRLSVQRKERKTSQKFYRKLTEPTFRAEKGVDQKSGQVLKNLSEMTKKIRFLELCKTHLQMLLTELHGLDPSYLYSLLALQDNKALVLQPYTENPSLQFQPIREPHSGCEVQVLHAGDPKGLMAYLFTASALSDGYIHQFLYTFRYFLTPEQLFDFLRTRYIAACRANPPDSNIARVMHRAVDLLHFWLEGFYSIDFERNTSLVQRLDAFVREYVNSANPDGASSLRHLMQACKHGPNSELLGDTIGDLDNEDRSTCFVHLETSKKKSRADMLDEWDSFRSGTKVKVTPKHRPSLPDMSMDLEKFRMARSMLDITSPMTFTRGRADSFSILDYSPNNLAEQLTLMDQDLFVLTHPVHYLNSKAQGVGVALSMPGMRTPSMQRRNREPEVTSLFVADTKLESVVQRIISYNQEVSHWVAAEIVTCTSSKSQCATMNKFIQLAQLCSEIRNFSTCLAILDGLENLIVRQLPTWKNLSSKCADIMEELEKMKVNVKGEQNYLMKDKDSHLYPTIPSVLYFLLHTQQLEIGSFQLANGMYKWTKMRSISKMIDQIRIFRENEYLFEPDETLQDAIQQRIMDFSDQDLHTIASTNETNFRKITGGGLSGVFKKVKGKLQSKGEK